MGGLFLLVVLLRLFIPTSLCRVFLGGALFLIALVDVEEAVAAVVAAAAAAAAAAAVAAVAVVLVLVLSVVLEVVSGVVLEVVLEVVSGVVLEEVPGVVLEEVDGAAAALGCEVLDAEEEEGGCSFVTTSITRSHSSNPVSCITRKNLVYKH